MGDEAPFTGPVLVEVAGDIEGIDNGGLA